MTNVAEVALIARVAESGLARVAPTLSERLVAELPQIFGGANRRLADLLGQCPEMAQPV